MKWAKALGAAVAVLALVALTAGSASASTALELKYEEEPGNGIFKPVVPGMGVEAASRTWALETPQGNVSCETETGFDGTVGVAESNGQRKDRISVNKTVEKLSGGGCVNTTPFFGPASLAITNLNTLNNEVHGTFELGDNGKATYTSGGSLDTVVQVQFPEAAGGPVTCDWEVKKLNGTEGPFPGEVSGNFAKQKVKLLRSLSNSAICSKHGTLSVNFNGGWWVGPEGAEYPFLKRMSGSIISIK